MSGFAADADAVAHVFVDALDDTLEITGDDGHHLARVRRLGEGEGVTAADGSGAWRPYSVAVVDRAALTLRATGPPCSEPSATTPLRVAFALTKGEKPETVVRHLTELGVDALLPVVAQRSVVRVTGERAEALVRRLRRVAREAACQSRRARIPRIEPPRPLAELLGDSLAVPGLVVAERAGAGAGPVPDPGPEGFTLVVGPEGGFGADEARALVAAPRVTVGAHVLRSETAAVAAAAVLTTHRGWSDAE